MAIIVIRPEDVLQLKKKHPCGGDLFRVVRVGAEVRIVCKKCGRDMKIDRIKLEKSIRQIVSRTDKSEGEEDGSIN